jgi:hypothetical protein
MVGTGDVLSDERLGGRWGEARYVEPVRRGSHGPGARSGASQGTIFGMTETAARRLYVSL